MFTNLSYFITFIFITIFLLPLITIIITLFNLVNYIQNTFLRYIGYSILISLFLTIRTRILNGECEAVENPGSHIKSESGK